MARKQSKDPARPPTLHTYSIRRRFVGHLDGEERVAWIELGDVEATNPPAALKTYGTLHAETIGITGDTYEAVSKRYRTERAAKPERQLTITWSTP